MSHTSCHTDIRFPSFDPSNQTENGRLQQFAATFGHRISSYRHPIKIITDGGGKEKGRWLGYLQFCFTPIVFPALHPEIITPREFKAVFDCCKGWAALQNGEGLLAVPTTGKSAETFNPEVMARCGMKRQEAEIYYIEGS